MWPFSTQERAKDVHTTCDLCAANKEELRQLRREVTNLLLDMENLRNNVLRKIQKRKATEPEETITPRKGGILKPSELVHNGLTE